VNHIRTLLSNGDALAETYRSVQSLQPMDRSVDRLTVVRLPLEVEA